MPLLAAVRREIDSLPRLFWWLFAGTIINKIGGFVVPLLALYVSGERGYGEAAAGLVVSSYGLGSLVAGMVGGVMADSVGRRATMLTSLFGGAAAMLALGFAQEIWQLVALSVVTGFLAEMYRPAVGAMVADIVPPEHRQRAYGHLYWAVNLGFAIAPMAAGLAAHVSYLLLFVIDAATMLLYGLLVLSRLPETRPAARAGDKAGPRSPFGGMGEVLRDAPFASFVGLVLITALVMWQTGSTLPLDMAKHGHDEATFGLLISINGVMIVLLQPSLSRMTARLDRTRMLVAGMLLFALGFGLQAVLTTAAGYGLCIAIWTLGEIITFPLSSAVIADLAPADKRGRYQGAFSMAWGVGSMVGPSAGGALLATAGGVSLWLVCAGLLAATSLGHALTGPWRERIAAARRAAPATDP